MRAYEKNRTKYRSQFLSTASVLCAFALSACTSGIEFKPHRVADQSEAGEAHVAGTFIAPWEDYVDRLSKEFKLKPEDALRKVLPQTSATEEQATDAVAARLRAELAPTPTGGGDPAPDLANADAGAATSPASALTGQLKLPDTVELAVDPFHQYTAAKSLHDEVQLLSNFVRDAARRHNMVPYITRVQITLSPYARHQPYDTHVTLSFFSEIICERPEEERIIGSRSGPCRYYRRSDPREADLKNAEGPKKWAFGWRRDQAVVVPLLITDSAERQLGFRSRDSIRQLSLALAAAQGGLAASLGLDARFEKLNSILANDFNSLMTVGRSSSSSVYVRLGAQTEATARYAGVPRNYNVTLLVMVPRDEKDAFSFAEGLRVGDVERIKISGSVAMRDSETGELLTRDPPGQRADEIKQLVSALLSPGKELENYHARSLLWALQANDFEWFRHTLSGYFVGETQNIGSVTNVWNAAIETLGNSGYVSDRIAVPKRSPPELPAKQTILIVDDGKKDMQVLLRGGHGLEGQDLTASLKLPVKKAGTVTLQAHQIAFDAKNGGLKLTFDSFAAYGQELASPASIQLILNADQREGYVNLDQLPTGPGCVTQSAASSKSNSACYSGALYRVTKAKAASAKKTLSLGSSVSTIAAKDGKGRLDLDIGFTKGTDPTKAQLAVSGATIAGFSASGGVSVTRGKEAATLVVTAPTILTLELENLLENTEVAVAGVGLDAANKAAGPVQKVALQVR